MRILFSIVLVCCSVKLVAQIPVPYTAPHVYNLNSPSKNDLYNYVSLRYDVSTNFLTNDVAKICEDCYGRIWVLGAIMGFACIDGGKVYHYGSHNGFFDRQQRIHADKFGGIWIGGNGTGVYHLESPGIAALYTRTPLFFPDSVKYDISDVHINGITSDKEGNVWIATALNGLTCIAKDSIYFIDPDPDQEDKGIRAIEIDQNGIVWFLYNHGLYYVENLKPIKYELLKTDLDRHAQLSLSNHDFVVLNDGTELWKIYKDSASSFNSYRNLPKNLIQSYIGPDGTLYARTNREIYKLVNNNFVLLFDGGSDMGITDFIVDAKNNVWITTRNHGLICFSNFSVNRFPKYQTLWNSPNKLIVHDDKSVFQLILSANKSEKKIVHFNLLPNEQIIACAITPYGFQYRTSLRIVNYNEETKSIQQTSSPNSLYNEFSDNYKNYITYQEKEKQVLTFSNSADIVTFDYPTKERIYLFHVDEKNQYFYLDGVLTPNVQVIKYSQGKIDTLFKNVGGDSLKITGAIYENDSTVYFSTWGLYILKVTGNNFEVIEENASSNILFSNFIDYQGNFWSGGIEGGITYFDAKSHKLAKFTPVEGFPGSRPIEFGISELNNDLVITTRSGLVWLKLVQDIPINSQEDFYKKYSIQVFGWKDGLYGQNFGGGHINEDGLLSIHGKDGVLQVIYPKDIEQSAPSNLHFCSIKSENIDREFNTFYRWYPGIKYNPVQSIELDYSENLLIEISSIYFDDHFNQIYSYRVDDKEWSEPSSSPLFRIAGLKGGKHKLSFIAYSSDGNASEPISIVVNVNGPLYESVWFWLVLFGVIIILFILIFRWRTFYMRKKARQLEQTVKERTAEIEFQKIEIETQHTEIKDSIQYAKRLQDAILPSNDSINQFIKNYFVFFKPKDVVSGDFYWFEHRHGATYFAVADCTGHGVPGALVSVVCSNALNRSIKEFNLVNPNEILDKTRELVIETFSSNNSNVKDGMDISICSFENNKIKFAGANNPLWVVRNQKYITPAQREAKNTELKNDLALIEFKGDKQPIGLFSGAQAFSQVEFECFPGDKFYLFSDGYADQFGGENHSLKKPGGKKLKYKPLKNIILDNYHVDLHKQGDFLNKTFDAWKGSFEQVDDVCVVGFSLAGE